MRTIRQISDHRQHIGLFAYMNSAGRFWSISGDHHLFVMHAFTSPPMFGDPFMPVVVIIHSLVCTA